MSTRFTLSITTILNILSMLVVSTIPSFTVEIQDSSSKPIEWFQQNCVSLRYGFEVPQAIQRICKITAFDFLVTLDKKDFYYALYKRFDVFPEDQELYSTSISKDNPPYDNTTAVIFEGSKKEGIKPILWVGVNDDVPGFSWFEKPKILHSKYGTILFIPHRYSGTGHFNEDKYFLRKDNQWKLVDTGSWLQDLRKRLPEKHDVWKGVVLDFVNMRVETPIWKEGDGNCCPSGGQGIITFELQGMRLVIKAFTHIPKKTNAR